MANREFDVIIFGASGFTGKYVVEEMAISVEMDSLYKSNNLRWAIAGRNHAKLLDTLKQAAKNTKKEWCTNVPIILADTDDPQSLLEMCKRTRLIVSVVGPYRFYGEPVVKACVEAATHYVDISGEPQFLETMQLKYNEAAKERGIYIVGSCGWDSIPADFGVAWTKQLFKGDLNHADVIMKSENPAGIKLNFGTWHSAIYGFAKAHELSELRRKLFSEDPSLKTPKFRSKHQPSGRCLMSYCEETKGYCLPFPGPDKSVIRRSEYYKYNTFREKPLHCETYYHCDGWLSGFMIACVALVFGSMAKFSLGRKLLKRYPGFFSFGVFTKGNIPEESILKSSSTHTIIGFGWDEKLPDIDAQHDTPPTKKIVTRVSGPNPGYIATSSYVVHSGMTIIFDPHHLPAPGVHTPGSCFSKSYLIDRLTKRNIKFEILEQA